MSDAATKNNAKSEDVRTAMFAAKPIPALGEFLKQSLDYWGEDGFLRCAGRVHEPITVQPVDSGGVDLIVSRPWAIAVVHDPSGSANKPVCFHADADMIAACKTPDVDRPFDCNGDVIDVDLPVWMKPGRVVITTENDLRPSSANTISPRPDGMSLIYVEPQEIPNGASKELGATIYKSCFPQLHDTQTVKHEATIAYGELLDDSDCGPADDLRLSSFAYSLIAAFGDYPVLRVRKHRGLVLVTYQDDPNTRLCFAQRKD